MMKLMVRERTLIEKTVFEYGPGGSIGRVISQRSIQDGPERVRDHMEGESDLPTPTPTHHLWEVGYWKRLQQAIRHYGIDGDR